MGVDLCEPILFATRPVIRDGCMVIEFVSTEPTRVTVDGEDGVGDCKHICAQPVFDPSTGTLRVAFESGGQLCVSDFGVLTKVASEDIDPIEGGAEPRGGEPVEVHGRMAALGTLVSPARGVLSGSVVIFSSSTECTPALAGPGDGPDCSGTTGPSDQAPDLPPECYSPPPDGVFCIYCEGVGEHDEPCQMGRACGSGAPPAGGRREVLAPPGALIRPDPGRWDILGDDGIFSANDGRTGLVRYYLKPLIGGVDPVFPDPRFDGHNAPCCTWLCRWKLDHTALKGWELHCVAPLMGGPGRVPPDQTSPRPIAIIFHAGRIVYVHFTFAALQPCFPLTDQFCLTHGNGSTEWGHLNEGNPKLTTLDHLAIDFNCRIATDAEKYPHTEPEYVEIMNDALAELSHLEHQIGQNRPNQGHLRNHRYDSPSLNLWWHDAAVGTGNVSCETAPVVHHGGTPGGEPWTVYVIPYGTDCRFPADLVLSRLRMSLRLSGDPVMNPMGGGNDIGDIRIPAVFDLLLDLSVRLRDGWQGIDCPVGFANGDPCDLTTNPDRHVVVASDGCSRVPLKIRWRGLNGPRPWSRSLFVYDSFCDHSLPACCDFLHAIDGLVIPGEVNDTSDPESPQRYDGDVVIMLNEEPADLGCGC